jgi:flagellar basal body L-ring protein FlgH
MKKIALLFALAGILSACAGTGTSTGGTAPSAKVSGKATQADAQSAIANAEAQIKAAKQKDALWSTTDKLLEDAQKAEKAGDNETAVKLAQKAAKQAMLAQHQAQEYANTQPHYE